MASKLRISVSPHIHIKETVQGIMLDVIISLLPAAIAGIIIFGWRALAVITTCIVASVASEYIFNRCVKETPTISDISAIVTGLLLALNLPANVPLWQAAVGSVFAIIIVKCFFGGMGCNLVNPAIAARVFMLVAFSSMATAAFPVDSVSSATPLSSEMPSLTTLFFGNYGGAIGETCTLALIIGFIYLLVRRVITWHIPVAFIGTVFLFTLALNGFDFVAALSAIMAGGLFIGAIFMATDYVTSPETWSGKLIFGLGAGIITVMIRQWGNYPEGVSFAILLMNILDPYVGVWTARKVFGGDKA